MVRQLTLSLYKMKRIPKYEEIYTGDEASKLFFKARTGSLELNTRTYRWSETRTKICQRCTYHTEEDLRHLLAECPLYENERKTFMTKMMQILGEDEWRKISKMEDDKDIAFILGLTEDSNEVVMEETKLFLHSIWKVRLRI